MFVSLCLQLIIYCVPAAVIAATRLFAEVGAIYAVFAFKCLQRPSKCFERPFKRLKIPRKKSSYPIFRYLYLKKTCYFVFCTKFHFR